MAIIFIELKSFVHKVKKIRRKIKKRMIYISKNNLFRNKTVEGMTNETTNDSIKYIITKFI